MPTATLGLDRMLRIFNPGSPAIQIVRPSLKKSAGVARGLFSWTVASTQASPCFSGQPGFVVVPSLLLDSFKTGRFGQIRFSPEEIGEVDRFMETFIAANISRTLKSLAFLRLSP